MKMQFEKAAMKILQSRLNDTFKFLNILSTDYKFSRHILEKDPGNQMYRRLAVRNCCCLTEGVTHSLKWLILTCSACFNVKLANAQVAALREEAYDLKENGDVSSRPQFFSFAKNFKFACATFVRVFHCTYSPNFRDEGWKCVQDVFEVRNRLMHPKELKGIEVSDAEVGSLKKADAWLQKVLTGLSESCDFSKVNDDAKREEISKWN